VNHLRAGASAAILLLLVACGGTSTTEPAGNAASDGAPASDGGGDSGQGSGGQGGCDLLSLSEVSDVVGAEATATLGSDELQGQSACNYNDADGIPIAAFAVTTSDSPISPSAGFDAVSEGAEPVSGLGDRAQWRPEGTLYVLSGDSLVAMSVFSAELDSEGKKQAAIDLVELILDRLG
jgi:hypothetical protein